VTLNTDTNLSRFGCLEMKTAGRADGLSTPKTPKSTRRRTRGMNGDDDDNNDYSK